MAEILDKEKSAMSFATAVTLWKTTGGNHAITIVADPSNTLQMDRAWSELVALSDDAALSGEQVAEIMAFHGDAWQGHIAPPMPPNPFLD